ncbi:MAG: ABC-F family ATP-binding cassette domain-containing protein [Clostridiales bacterium]|nr:ABC-F family ATP-binding cassette domain-containing protein [Clostridiales bacterium]
MLISADNLQFGFNGDSLLENVSFALSEGERVGLIGANGEGKTTLIRLILGELDAEGGILFKKNGIRIGYLAQNGGYDSSLSVFEEMREIFQADIRAIESLREIEQKIAVAEENSVEYRTLSAKYESLNKQIAARDSYNYEVRIRTVLNGMGFENVYNQQISTMSGGEKTRLKLCRLLLEDPELLILDEPTNHLDMKTLFWLEDYLATYKGAILTVSHDRYFLDKIVSQIYEIENKKLCVFKGNYSKYKILKAEKTAHLLKEYEKQQEERAHMQEYVDRNLVRASTTKMAQSRRKALEKMELIEKPALPPTPPRFSFSYAEKPYEKVLDVVDLKLTAGEKTLLEKASFSLMRGEKCAVVGDNGTGKSTLVKEIIRNKNAAIRLGRFVKIACYDQENANLDPNNSVLQELWNRHVLWDQTKVRNILAQAGLPAEDMDKKVRMLSGGERAKLALAVFECECGNVLILDEPTNHLDLPARESLETALKEFDGTILFVSHDRYFIRALAGKILELENGCATEFTGSYDEYNAFKQKEKETARNTVQRTPAPTISINSAQKDSYYRSKEERAADAKRRTRIKKIEEEISALESEDAEINSALSTPEVTGNFALLTEKCNRLEEIKTLLDALYNEYETLI